VEHITVLLLVSTLRTKMRSNLHIGQYAGSIPSDHSLREVLVKPLLLLRVTRHINKFICEATQKRAGWLAIHTGGSSCDLLKEVILEEVIVFSAFCSFSLLLLSLPIACFIFWSWRIYYLHTVFVFPLFSAFWIVSIVFYWFLINVAVVFSC